MAAWGMIKDCCVREIRRAKTLYRSGDTTLEEEQVRLEQERRGRRYLAPTFGKKKESRGSGCRSPVKAPTSYLFYEVRMVDNRCSGPSLDTQSAK